VVAPAANKICCAKLGDSKPRPKQEVWGEAIKWSQIRSSCKLLYMGISVNTEIMGGKPCIDGTRVTVSVILGLIASGKTHAEILQAYPYLTEQSIKEAVEYAAWRLQEQEVVLTH
jgi:uncharacterized protein (DUF433 family)